MTTLQQVARGVDLLALAFAFGATAWFFFVQAPVLGKKLGRECFVPIQMFLTRLLFQSLVVTTFVVVVAALVHSGFSPSFSVVTAVVALAGALINHLVVVPKALRAGGRGKREVRGKDDEASVAGFASEGVGSATKTLHRTVVLFVVVMLGGLVPQGMALMGM